MTNVRWVDNQLFESGKEALLLFLNIYIEFAKSKGAIKSLLLRHLLIQNN